MRVRRNSGKAVVIVIVAIVGVMIVLCSGVALAVILPAIQQARTAARNEISSNKLKQIGIALHNYHDTYLAFPPGLIEDEDGQARTSWRAMLLPFMLDKQHRKYNDYDYNVAWDDPKNQEVVNLFPDIYASPNVSESGYTPYVAVLGPRTAISRTEKSSIFNTTDGSSNTLCIIEDTKRPVAWNSPQDISFDEFLARYDQEDFQPRGVLVLMVDGSVRYLQYGHGETARNLADRADGNPVAGF